MLEGMAADRSIAQGYAYAVAAFLLWGLVPIYFKAVGSVSPLEVLAQRVVWSVPLCALFLFWQKGWPALKEAVAKPRVLVTLGVTSALIAANWLVFIHAVTSGQVLAASLGYFISPLMNLLMGMIFLGERPNRAQLAAMSLAALGTLNMVLFLGHLPWISLFLATSFSTYGLLRKTVAVEAVGGLLVETVLLSPLALAWLGWLVYSGNMAFVSQGPQITLLLMAAGLITSLPLILFTAGARRIPFYAVGLCQYIAPSLQFLLAVALYHETFTATHMVTFSLVWAGLALYLFAGYRRGA